MIEFIRLFIYDLFVKLAVLTLGLFSVILIAENGAALEAIEKYKYLLMVAVLVLVTERLFYFIRYRRYIIMPYSLSLYNRANNENKDSKIYLDKFKQFDSKSQTIYFKNRLAIDKELYIKNKAKIIHLLGFEDDKEVEIEIKAHNKKEIAIRLYRLPQKFNWHIDLLRDEHIYLGHSKDGPYYIPLNEMTSGIICGESGSGKSNWLNMIILSLLHNKELLDDLYFIDLKGVELSRYKLDNTKFVSTLEGTDKLLQELKETMEERFEIMQQKEDLVYDGKFKICLIDEVGTISTQEKKEVKQRIFNNLIEIAQKGRASKVLLFIFSQKIDTTNIPTNVLTNLQFSSTFRSSSQFNITNTVGLQEEVEEITRNRVQDFPKGRLIYSDGLDKAKKVLLQSPYLSQEVQSSMIKHFREWINK